MAIVLALAILACAFTGTGSRSAYTLQNHLPTLTRTPLPTLTPTGIATPVAVAEVAEDLSPPSVPQAGPVNPTAPTQSITASASTNPANLSPQDVAAAPAEPVPINSGNGSINPPQPTILAALPPTSPPPTTTSISAPTSTPTPPQAWAFNGVQLYPNPYNDGLLLYGNLVNNTSTAQKLKSVLGTFYDSQNQVIAGPDSSEAYWPAYVVAPGASMPFELDINAIGNAANFDLDVAAEPSDEIPRQDFEFSDIDQWTDEEAYCLKGKLRNSGGQLQEYLIIAVILYDSQNNVVNFGDYGEFGNGMGGDDQEFEICVNLSNQEVARYELRAWGS